MKQHLNMTGFLSVNRSLMTGSCEIRQLRLPRSSPFPKLDSRAVLSAHHDGRKPAGGATGRVPGAVMISGSAEGLPEMTSDVMDRPASYTGGNVRRERAGLWQMLGQWMGRLLCGVSGARRG